MRIFLSVRIQPADDEEVVHYTVFNDESNPRMVDMLMSHVKYLDPEYLEVYRAIRNLNVEKLKTLLNNNEIDEDLARFIVGIFDRGFENVTAEQIPIIQEIANVIVPHINSLDLECYSFKIDAAIQRAIDPYSGPLELMKAIQTRIPLARSIQNYLRFLFPVRNGNLSEIQDLLDEGYRPNVYNLRDLIRNGNRELYENLAPYVKMTPFDLSALQAYANEMSTQRNS